VKHKRILIVVALSIVVLAEAAVKFRKTAAQPKQSVQQVQAIPEFEVYRQLFHHNVTMKHKADELEKQGKDGKFLREFYKRQAKLTDDEANVFDDIASKCDEEVARQDAMAKAIIDKQLVKNGNGKLAKGDRPSEPPPELRTLWDERNAIVMRYRYGLEAAFGASEFKRFSDYVNQDVMARMSNQPPSQPHPTPMGLKRGPRVITGPTAKPEER